MIWVYVTIVLLGLTLFIRLASWRSPHALTAGIGTVFAVLALLGGFSIGFVIAPVALLTLSAAVIPHLRK